MGDNQNGWVRLHGDGKIYADRRGFLGLLRADALAMGCCASKKADEPGPPPHLQAATARTVRLLESLAVKEKRVEQPVLTNSERQRSGQRGMTRALLFGVKAFYAQRGALDKTMQDIVNEPGFPFSACELTKSTGLSLTETLVREAYREAGEGEGIEELVGEATCFFSYSWTGTKLRDLLAAIERVLAKLEAADGKCRYVWVDTQYGKATHERVRTQ